MIRFRVNGKDVEVDAPPMKRLLDVLRGVPARGAALGGLRRDAGGVGFPAQEGSGGDRSVASRRGASEDPAWREDPPRWEDPTWRDVPARRRGGSVERDNEKRSAEATLRGLRAEGMPPQVSARRNVPARVAARGARAARARARSSTPHCLQPSTPVHKCSNVSPLPPRRPRALVPIYSGSSSFWHKCRAKIKKSSNRSKPTTRLLSASTCSRPTSTFQVPATNGTPICTSLPPVFPFGFLLSSRVICRLLWLSFSFTHSIP